MRLNSYLNQFQSRDPFPGQNRLPQTQNGYSYVNSNPVNYTDPSGLCAENFDEGCWAIYEQIIRLCTECAQMKRAWVGVGGYRYLHEEQIGYLQTKLEEVRRGWRPDFTSYTDGVSLYLSFPIAPIKIPGVGAVAGIEVLYNLHTYKYTAFAVAGGSLSIGAELSACVQINDVRGIGDDNLSYRGKFVFWNLSGSYVLGANIGSAWTPADEGLWPFNYLDRDDEGPYSYGAGPTVGVGASASVGVVEYLPLFSWKDKSIEFHASWYLFEDEEKWIIGSLFRDAIGLFLYAGYSGWETSVNFDPNLLVPTPGAPNGTPTMPSSPPPQGTPSAVPARVP